MMIVMMLRFSVSAGRLRLPSSDKQDDFGANKELVSRAIDEYRGALGRASLPVMALVSALYAIGFLVLRAGVAASLGVFKNLYVAGFSAAIVGAVIIFPSLLPSIVASLKRRGVVADIPVAAQGIGGLRAELNIVMGPDGGIQTVAPIDAARMSSDPVFRAFAESAVRAVRACSPLKLPPESYQVWRNIIFNFDPSRLTG